MKTKLSTLSISIIINVKCIVDFDDKKYTINNYSQEIPMYFKGVHEGGLYSLLIDTTKNEAIVNYSGDPDL